jgi:phospholipase D1/2
VTDDIKPASVDKDCMRDPLNDSFFEDTWRQIAENNTKIFRRVFRCNPDSEVTNWHEYTEFVAYAERFAQAQNGAKSTEREEQEAPGRSGPTGASTAAGLATIVEAASPHRNGDHTLGTAAEWADRAKAENKARPDTSNVDDPPNGQLDGSVDSPAMRPVSGESGVEVSPPLEPTIVNKSSAELEDGSQLPRRITTLSSAAQPENKTNGNAAPNANALTQGSVKRRRRGTTKTSRRGFSASDDLLSQADTEELLSMVQGNLVVFPYDWLVKEELNSNWLYQVDQVAPLQI